MSDYKPTSSDDVVYVDYSTSGTGALLYESSATPASLASIMRNALVLFEVLPPSAMKPREPGLQPGSIWVSDDFDEPLPDEFWTGAE
jgi:hypothetical protein